MRTHYTLIAHPLPVIFQQSELIFKLMPEKCQNKPHRVTQLCIRPQLLQYIFVTFNFRFEFFFPPLSLSHLSIFRVCGIAHVARACNFHVVRPTCRLSAVNKLNASALTTHMLAPVSAMTMNILESKFDSAFLRWFTRGTLTQLLFFCALFDYEFLCI